jgi:cyclase
MEAFAGKLVNTPQHHLYGCQQTSVDISCLRAYGLVETGHRGSNNVIIETDDGLVLVDAPHRPSDAVRWSELVQASGDVRYLIHTDHHIDHVLGNRWLPGTVVAHDRTRERLLHGAASAEFIRSSLEVIDPVGLELLAGDVKVRLPEVTFNRRLTLHVGGVRLELHHLGGHTDNTIAVHLPDEGVLISGDNVIHDFGLPAFSDGDIHAHFTAFDALERLEFDTLVPGHGEVTDRSAIGAYRDQILVLLRKIESAMSAGATRDEVAETIRYEDRLHTALNGEAGYPPEFVEFWQRASQTTLYDQLVERGPIATRAR